MTVSTKPTTSARHDELATQTQKRWVLKARSGSVDKAIAAAETNDRQGATIARRSSSNKQPIERLPMASKLLQSVFVRSLERQRTRGPVPYTRGLSSSTKFLSRLWPKTCVAFASLGGLEDAMENTFFRLTEESRHLS